MNRNILAGLIHAIYCAPADGDGGGAGGGGGQGGEGNTPQVKPEEARAFLADFGHDPEALKTAKDEDVVKRYGTVSANFTKRAQAEATAAAEKQKQQRLEAAKGLKLELPQDSKLHQTDVERIAAFARERGLSADEAKALLSENDTAVKSFEARLVETANAKREGWVKEWQADPALGGEKLATTQKNIQRVIDKFMPQEMQAELAKTPYGAHPGFVKFLNSIGAAMAEDGGINGGQGGGQGEMSAADRLYGSKSQ